MKNLIIEKIVKKITKNILSEGSLDKPILDISREVIRLFKNEESDEFTYVFYRSGEEIQLLVDFNI
jgi:hypothetical protein